MMSFIRALVTNPSLVLHHRNIFLLSHMRANTSLFGHLLGSHPDVEGYYEMHIGYYSWKSLWRQKLVHFGGHDVKPTARWIFDKVLHDGHYVAPQLLLRPTTRTIIMVRAPGQSIRSLVTLYREGGNAHLPEATPEGAARYYIDRLASLCRTADLLKGRYFYLDAESLLSDSAATLIELADWLGLDGPIPTEYQTFPRTGKGNAGDTSSRLKAGRISQGSRDYAEIVVPPALMTEAETTYERVRAMLASVASTTRLHDGTETPRDAPSA